MTKNLVLGALAALVALASPARYAPKPCLCLPRRGRVSPAVMLRSHASAEALRGAV